MKDLYFSELRRFRSAALIAAAIHLVLQLFLQRMSDLLQLRWEMHMPILGVYLLAGLAFAMIQFGSYRQPGRWIFLLHRPLSHARVFAAIALASATLLLFAIGLPALLSVLCTDLFSAHVVDTRHYLLVILTVLLTGMAWLAGSYAILSARRTAITILLLPILMLIHLASAWTLLPYAIACVGLLTCITLFTFKPDRTAAPNGLALAATAAPLLAGLYFVLVWGGSLLYQQVTILAGVHPLNRAVPPAGGYTESTRSESRDVLLRGLASATDPRAAQWRRQIALLDVANFQPTGNQHPVRHQASNLDELRFVDQHRHIEWTFSHDAMRFEGRDTDTSRHKGWLGLHGIGDTTAFPMVPVIPLPYIMMRHGLLAWDEVAGKLTPLIELPDGETLAREPKVVDPLLYVITNRRVIAYDKPAPGAAPALLVERYSIKLPEPLSDLDRVDIASLMDAKLVSLSFGKRMAKGDGDASQTIYLVDAAGRSSLVARRALTHDFPLLFEHHKWWVSPLLHLLLAAPEALLDKGFIVDQMPSGFPTPYQVGRPPAAWLAALAGSLLAALGAWWWLQRTRTGKGRRAGWIGTCLLLGLPALACLAVLQAREPRPVTKQAKAPAPVAAA